MNVRNLEVLHMHAPGITYAGARAVLEAALVHCPRVQSIHFCKEVLSAHEMESLKQVVEAAGRSRCGLTFTVWTGMGVDEAEAWEEWD